MQILNFQPWQSFFYSVIFSERSQWASGNKAAYDSAVSSMKCTAKAAISIGAIITILICAWTFFVFDTVGDIMNGTYDYSDPYDHHDNSYEDNNPFGNIFNDIGNAIEQATEDAQNNPFGNPFMWKSEEQ